jgi:hypothetical protein
LTRTTPEIMRPRQFIKVIFLTILALYATHWRGSAQSLNAGLAENCPLQLRAHRPGEDVKGKRNVNKKLRPAGSHTRIPRYFNHFHAKRRTKS